MSMVNLGRERKSRAKIAKKSQADANSVKFGQSLSARNLQAAKIKQLADRLAAHKRDDT